MNKSNKLKASNIMVDIPEQLPVEVCNDICKTDSIRIERIVSRGHVSGPNFWYDQEWHEWVLVMEGRAILEFEGSDDVELLVGDYLLLPAHKKHRVKWTDPDKCTVWLAIHFK